MMRVLVTGATGTIGRRVCDALHESVFVRASSRSIRGGGPWSECVACDLSGDLPARLLDGIDTVVHAAGRAHVHDARLDDDREYEAVNVDGTRRLCDAAVAAGVERFVLVSSVAVLGDGGDRPVSETADPAPTSAYARSKLAAERVVAAAPFGSIVLRFPLVYGPGAPGNLHRMVQAIARRRLPPVPPVANRRSMIHVGDAAAAVAVCAARAPRGSVYTVTDGGAYSTHDVYVWTLAALGRRPPSVVPPAWLFRLLARAGDAAGTVIGHRAPFDSAAWRKLFGSAEYESVAIRRDLGFEALWDLRRALPAIVAAARAGRDSA
jgi:nucleoside-diphosphate-sugar epimerase